MNFKEYLSLTGDWSQQSDLERRNNDDYARKGVRDKTQIADGDRDTTPEKKFKKSPEKIFGKSRKSPSGSVDRILP